jgi:hypothetical protein
MVPSGIEKTMIRRLRFSAPARVALAAAAILSLVAAFGLHPEPDDPCSGVGPRFARTALHTTIAHDCVACLHAGSAVVALEAVLDRSTDSAPAPIPARDAPPCSEVLLGLTGRSPPAIPAS